MKSIKPLIELGIDGHIHSVLTRVPSGYMTYVCSSVNSTFCIFPHFVQFPMTAPFNKKKEKLNAYISTIITMYISSNCSRKDTKLLIGPDQSLPFLAPMSEADTLGQALTKASL